MAFWRWSTMDSINPFKIQFWSFGNLFGQSNFEKVEALKRQKIKSLLNQIKFSHPKNSTSIISCPLTNKAIVNPVITIEGKLYEKYALLRRIASFNNVPGSNNRLTRDDIYEFKGLNAILKYAKSKRDVYFKTEQEILSEAQKIAATKASSTNHASLFICPLSKQYIKEPVISPLGRVYEKESIQAYFQTTSNEFDPIDGTPLRIDSLVEFEEFELYLETYSNNLAKILVQAAQIGKEISHGIKTGIDFFSSKLVSEKIPDEEGKMIPRPGMDFF